MRHLRRILGVLFLLAAIVAIAIAVSIRVLPETDLIKSRVQDQLSNLIGQKVTLGSMKVSWSIPRLISLNVEGISIASREGTKLLSADRLILIPSLSLLFRKEIAVESITVQGLHATIRRSSDGTIVTALIPLPAASANTK